MKKKEVEIDDSQKEDDEPIKHSWPEIWPVIPYKVVDGVKVCPVCGEPID